MRNFILSLPMTIAVATSASAAGAPSAADAVGTRTVYASAAGAALNSNLATGGGTDDTAILQQVLNRAEKGTPIHLIIDGPALVSGLDVYGNTTVECIAGGGLYLKSGSNRAIIRNAHRSRDAIIDEHIAIRGCFLHGNKLGQGVGVPTYPWNGVKYHRNQEADNSYFAGLQFFGVNYLTIENVTLWNIRAFASHVANANRIDVRNVIVDNGIQPGDHWYNMDGFHFDGPIHYLTIDGMKLRTYDDGLSLTANDDPGDVRINNNLGPYVGQGPITDVTVNNVEFMDSLRGIRLLSSTERIDRVVINNVTGTVQTILVLISHGNHPGLGNIGSVSINNVAADGIKFLAPLSRIYGSESYKEYYNDPIGNLDLGGLNGSLFVVNAHVESLNLGNIMTRAIDSRPVLWIGYQSLIGMLNADLSIYDPEHRGTALREEKGSRIERLNLRVNGRDGRHREAGVVPEADSPRHAR